MSGPIQVAQEAIFTGANKQGFVFDYRSTVVAFGAGTTVALWNPLAEDKRGVYQTLNAHEREVTCVRFIEDKLLTCAEDGKICLWTVASDSAYPTYQLAQSNELEDCSITTLAIADNKRFITGDSSGTVKFWAITDAGLEITASLSVKRNFYPTAVCVQKIDTHYLLVVGGTSSDLFIYSVDPSFTKLVQSAVLTGHEDWIKCLSFVTEKEGADYILASGSQDRYIRLWRLRLNEAIDDSDEDESKLVLLSNKQYKFAFGEGRAAFSFEALIMGHDDWVTDLKWHPSTSTDSGSRKLQLLSSSADTSLMIWEMDPDSGIWVTASRLGEMSIKGASTATGASGGFSACAWFQDPTSSTQFILASGKTGAIRVYQSHDDTWDSVLGVTGATREITDLVWSIDGSYCLATSLDQTTRLFAPWSKNRPHHDSKVTWHEFARPQIHGYDMICLDNLSATKFVSGGDEKVLRVFEMTQSINTLLHKFCDVEVDAEPQTLPESASLPVLGLSNKAANEQLEAGEAQQREENFQNEEEDTNEVADVLTTLHGPPLEDHLQRHTLFPELEKLYGHGYEITCCASSPRHTLIASACRSNSAKHAVIRIFNAQKELQLVEKVLTGHNLTITSLEFSPDGEYLLAVSRDRQFSLWRVSDEKEGQFELIELNPKAHTRIIWDCSWGPQGTSVFVTGSRDKSIKVWSLGKEGVATVASIKTEAPVTSVSCYQRELVNGQLIISAGHETGAVTIFSLAIDDSSLKEVHALSSDILPASRVSKLAFSNAGGPKLQLAVGSSDRSVRIYSVEKGALVNQ